MCAGTKEVDKIDVTVFTAGYRVITL